MFIPWENFSHSVHKSSRSLGFLPESPPHTSTSVFLPRGSWRSKQKPSAGGSSLGPEEFCFQGQSSRVPAIVSPGACTHRVTWCFFWFEQLKAVTNSPRCLLPEEHLLQVKTVWFKKWWKCKEINKSLKLVTFCWSINLLNSVKVAFLFFLAFFLSFKEAWHGPLFLYLYLSNLQKHQDAKRLQSGAGDVGPKIRDELLKVELMDQRSVWCCIELLLKTCQSHVTT